jgi:hypothetical protein
MRNNVSHSGAASDGAVSTVCHFGARRVGTLLERLRLHLATQRFLAHRRGDLIWEAGCDYAAMTLTRLESQLSFSRLQRHLIPEMREPRLQSEGLSRGQRGGQSGPQCGRRSRQG